MSTPETETQCLLAEAKSMFGDTGNDPRISTGYKIKRASPMKDLDKATGQALLPCDNEGCICELEVYPNPHTSGEYDVQLDSLKAARFVCKVAKGEK